MRRLSKVSGYGRIFLGALLPPMVPGRHKKNIILAYQFSLFTAVVGLAFYSPYPSAGIRIISDNRVSDVGYRGVNLLGAHLQMWLSVLMMLLVLLLFVIDLVLPLGEAVVLGVKKLENRKGAIRVSMVLILCAYVGRLLFFGFLAGIGLRAGNTISVVDSGVSLLPENFVYDSGNSSLLYDFTVDFPLTGAKMDSGSVADVSVAVRVIKVSRLVLITLLLGVSYVILSNLYSTLVQSSDQLRANLTKLERGKLSLVYQSQLGATAHRSSFLDVGRALSYASTQEFIVDKSLAFTGVIDEICRLWVGRTDELLIFSPGIGVGDFEVFLLGDRRLSLFSSVRIFGIDFSGAMTDVCVNRISKCFAGRHSRSWPQVDIKILSGLDLVDQAQGVLDDFVSDGMRFHAIFSCQFEHYFPNSRRSQLARSLRDMGASPLTKRDMRSKMRDLLVEGGVYFVLDDLMDENAVIQAQNELAWDRSVAQRFADPRIVEKIRLENPEAAKTIGRLYDPKLQLPELAARVREVRKRRRERCLEEVALRGDFLEEICEIFGTDNVKFGKEAFDSEHQNFFLAQGIRF